METTRFLFVGAGVGYGYAFVLGKHWNLEPEDYKYLLADELEPGGEEFATLFDLTVRLFPGDPVANLNAANAAIRCLNLTKARAYLDRAGEGPEAEYARGVRDYWDGAFDSALAHLRNAYDGGVQQAADLIEVLQTIDRGTLEASRRSALRDALNRLGHGGAL